MALASAQKSTYDVGLAPTLLEQLSGIVTEFVDALDWAIERPVVSPARMTRAATNESGM
jgi:hypothetical protein